MVLKTADEELHVLLALVSVPDTSAWAELTERIPLAVPGMGVTPRVLALETMSIKGV